MQNISSKIFGVFFPVFAIRISSLVFLMISSRIITPQEFGIFATFQLIIVFFDMFMSACICTPVVQAKNLKGSTNTSLLIIVVCISIFMIFAVNIGTIVMQSLFINAELIFLMQIGSSLIILNSIENFLGAIMLRNQWMVGFSRARALGVIGCHWLIGLPLLTNGFSYFALLAHLVFGSIVTCFIMVCMSKLRAEFHYPSFSKVSSIIKHGSGYLSARFLLYIGNQGPSIVIVNLLGPEILGIFNRSSKLVELTYTIFSIVSTRVMVPTIAHSDSAFQRQALLSSVTLTALLFTPISFLIYYFSNDIVLIVLGKQWMAAIPIIQVLAPVLFFKAIRITLTNYLTASGDTRNLNYVNLLSAISICVTSILMVSHGLKAIAWAVSIGWILTNIFTVSILIKFYEFRLSEFIQCFSPSLLYLMSLMLFGFMVDFAGFGDNKIISLIFIGASSTYIMYVIHINTNYAQKKLLASILVSSKLGLTYLRKYF